MGRRTPLKPPRSKMNVGAGDFTELGRSYLKLFVQMGGLTPADRVLDVGCGIGHMAVALTSYLDPRGGYEGFDVVAQGIKWCNTAITPRFPHFRFQHIDIYNREYNPKGTIKPSEFVFPYANDTFDFVLCTSVFTHMRLEDVDGYLAEISRVLKVGGRCFSTFFLTDTSSPTAGAGPGLSRFCHTLGGSLTIDQRSPEKALAHPETAVKTLFSAHHLHIDMPIHGDWRMSADLLGSQDIVVARRRT